MARSQSGALDNINLPADVYLNYQPRVSPISGYHNIRIDTVAQLIQGKFIENASVHARSCRSCC